MPSVIQESLSLPVAGEAHLEEGDPRRPCGQHYRMLLFTPGRSGIVSVRMDPCGANPLLHPFLTLFYGKGMSGVRLAMSGHTEDGGAAASFYATGGELYTVVFSSFMPGEVGFFNFSITDGRSH